jgi:hypothetical protein
MTRGDGLQEKFRDVREHSRMFENVRRCSENVLWMARAELWMARAVDVLVLVGLALAEQGRHNSTDPNPACKATSYHSEWKCCMGCQC